MSRTELATALLTTRTAYLAALATGDTLRAAHMDARMSAILEAMLS
jgi:hypothetical protein